MSIKLHEYLDQMKAAEFTTVEQTILTQCEPQIHSLTRLAKDLGRKRMVSCELAHVIETDPGTYVYKVVAELDPGSARVTFQFEDDSPPTQTNDEPNGDDGW